VKNFYTILAVLITNSLFAQNLGTWNVFDVKKNGRKGTSYQLEGQVRSLKFYDNFHYNELNFTTNFKYNENLILSVLLGKHNTYSEGGSFISPIVTDEYRLSLQAATSQKFGRLFLDNRYRIEQRYFINNSSVNYRMRYRFGLKSKISKINYLQFSNEFFLAIGNRNSTFEKNRFLFGITNEINKKYEVQINFLNQIDTRLNDESGNNFFQIVNIIKLN
jgi:hypothetical protein